MSTHPANRSVTQAAGAATPAPAPWTPVLQGEIADRAWDAIRDVARALHGPQEYRGPEDSLAEGRAGVALFHAYLCIATGDDAARQQVFRRIESALDGVAEAPPSTALYFGFPGVAWTLEHLDGRIGEPNEEDLNGEADGALLDSLRGVRHADWYGGHDLMFGLAGLVVYAVERLPRPSAWEILRRVIDKLEATAERRDGSIAWSSPADLLPPETRARFPDGVVYSLGVSHGTPGVIGALAMAYAAGVERSRVGGLLAGAVRWLLAQRLAGTRGSSFANWVSRDPTPARSSWCYGNPGIAPVLLAAGRATGEGAWERIAVDLAREAANRPPGEAGIIDGGLCHGAAGLGHLLNRVFQATGDRRLLEAARFWFARTLEMRRPGEGLGGFLSYRQAGNEPESSLMTDPGLLTGVAGTGLALLAAVAPQQPAWDRVFLASIPPSAA